MGSVLSRSTYSVSAAGFIQRGSVRRLSKSATTKRGLSEPDFKAVSDFHNKQRNLRRFKHPAN